MTTINSIVLASLFVLTQKQIADIRYSSLIFESTFYSRLAVSFLALSVTAASIPVLLFSGYTKPILGLLMAASLVLNIIKRSRKLYNSIEEIYESLLIITIGMLWLSPVIALLCSSLVLASSVSAGISKYRSEIWFGGARSGFLMFCTLPSTSRRIVSSLASDIAKRIPKTKKLWRLISWLTPLVQVSSALLLVISMPGTIAFYLSLGAQILFAMALFFISDLSWITSLYLCLVGLFASTKAYVIDASLRWPYTTLAQGALLITGLYVLICYLLVLCPGSVDRLDIIKRNRGVFLGLVPFKMFTEIHMVNIITHYFDAMEDSEVARFNAFDECGIRSANQNFNSRHLQALMYPLGDMLVKAFSFGILQGQDRISHVSEVSKSGIHQKQIIRIAHAIGETPVEFFQHSFDSEGSCYKSSKIARCHFFIKGKEMHVRFDFLGRLLPVHRV